MKEFHIQKRDPNQKRIRNKVEDYDTAVSRPLEKRPNPWQEFSQKVSKFKNDWLRRRRKANLQNLTIFTRQLATLLKSGVPLSNCFSAFNDPSDNIHDAMQEVAKKIESGMTLSKAFRTMPNIWGPIYCGLVESGERTGMLVEVLEKLARDLEKDLQTTRKLKAALSYPAILCVAALACVTWFVFGVMPMLEPMFTSMRVELPLATRILLRFKEILVIGGLVSIVTSIVAYFGYKLLCRNPDHRRRLHQAFLWIPMFGRIYRTVTVARIMQSIATMLEVGMTIIPCLSACQSLTSNAYIAHQVNEVKERVIDGDSIAKSAQIVGLFPRTATQLIAVGEETSALFEMLKFAANLLNEDCETEIDRFANNIEPIIMGVMGIVVGFIVIAAMLPIVQLISSM